MNFEDLTKRVAKSNPLKSHQMNRRETLQRMGAMIAAGSAASMLPGAVRAAEREVRLATYDGYTDSRVLDSFTEQTGQNVNYELHISDPDAVNKLRAGQTQIWDVINLNNPWARKVMWPEGLIRDLPKERFEGYYDKMLPMFKPPFPWATSADGEHLLGMTQRVDTFDFVINTDSISIATAEDQGWDLFNDPDMAGKYGLLAYADFNIMQMCMGAGVHPFEEKDEMQIAKFEATARQWIKGAKIISDDFNTLNLALLNGEIITYAPGGVYSISAARLEGETQLYHASPKRGAAGGKGGLNWIELNSAVNNPDFNSLTLDWLEFIAQPDIAYYVSTSNGILVPVAQMSQPEVFNKYTTEQLNAFQWDTFEERISRAVQYDVIPQYDTLYDIYTKAFRDRQN